MTCRMPQPAGGLLRPFRLSRKSREVMMELETRLKILKLGPRPPRPCNSPISPASVVLDILSVALGKSVWFRDVTV